MLTASRNPLLAAGGVLLLAGTGLLLRQWVAAPPPVVAPMPEPLRPAAPLNAYVVALKEIPRGEVVTAEALGLLGMDRAPSAEAVTRIDQAVGRVAVERIGAGQTVLAGALTAGPAGAGLAALVPAEMRAVTLRVAEDTGVAFLIRAGDRVDVALATQDDGQPGDRPAARSGIPDLSRLLLQDVAVLAVGEALGREAPDGQGRGPVQRSVTLAIAPAQVPVLALARGDGGYLFALRNPADRSQADAGRALRGELLGAAPPVAAAAPAPRPAAPRILRSSGPEIIRGAMGGTP
jgi:pilus assembly protein CpaB